MHALAPARPAPLCLAVLAIAGLGAACLGDGPAATADGLLAGDDAAAPDAAASDPAAPDAAAADTVPSPVCAASAVRCHAATAERCADDGQGWLIVADCGAADRCQGGVCLDAPCVPGAQCVGDTAVLCPAGGHAPTALADCAMSDRVCSGGHCVPEVCVPGVQRCHNGLLAACLPSGTFETFGPCPSGTVCMTGDDGASACRPGVCPPERRWCVGDTARACSEDGATISDTPCGDDQVCVDGGCQVPPNCFTPVILLSEASTVVAQTVLHLSTEPHPDLVGTHWSVEQPDGSASTLLPSSSAPTVAFAADVVGTYVFRLELTYASEPFRALCGPAELTVHVVPAEALHVELLWETPNDSDPYDGGPVAGADLDLHFVASAWEVADGNADGIADGLFDPIFDTFWFNPSPNWGGIEPSVGANAHLDRDDVDGSGPENLNLMIPSVVGTYDVFVHAWNDHGFGPSWATVRIYFYGALVFEAQRELHNSDMWPVGRINWAASRVDPLGGCTDTGALCIADATCPAGTCEAVVWPGYLPTLFPNR